MREKARLQHQQRQPEMMNEARYAALGIGVATSRLRSRFRRASTTENPIPQMPLPSRFMPSKPGTTKSM